MASSLNSVQIPCSHASQNSLGLSSQILPGVVAWTQEQCGQLFLPPAMLMDPLLELSQGGF